MITHVFNSTVVSGPEVLVLPALRNLGEPVSVIFLSESRRAEESQKPIEYARQFGYPVYSVQVRSRWDRQAFRELRELLERIRPRVVHAHDVKASLYVDQARRVRKGFEPKLVSTHHGAAARYGIIRLYEEIYVRFVLPHFDHVLAVCSADRESIIRRGIDPKKVSIHLNGTNRPQVDPALRSEASSRIRQSWRKKMPTLPADSQALFLGAVARLSPEKRHDRMLQVLRHLKEQNAYLVCFGIGAEEQKLRALAQQLGIADRVFWMGYSNTISNEIAGFDLLLSLSDGEGIPINLIEAGWAATPVVATRVGGIPDLIPSGEVGILVQKEDADDVIADQIRRAVNDRQILKRIGINFQNRVTQGFSESAWLERLRQVYASL